MQHGNFAPATHPPLLQTPPRQNQSCLPANRCTKTRRMQADHDAEHYKLLWGGKKGWVSTQKHMDKMLVG